MSHRWSVSVLLSIVLLLGSFSGVRAQTPIAAGQTVNGTLAASDPLLDDGSHYDLYEYRGRAGDRIRITMRSSAFDAYLAGGVLQGGDLSVADTNDDGGGGTDSQLTVTVEASGVYVIRANSLSSGQTGAYTLSVEALGGGAATSTPQATGARQIAAGQTISSSLDASDPVLSDGSHYETYVYRGRAGEQIVVIMRSSDFDSYLAGGTPNGANIDSQDTNDDGAGGRDAMLSVTVPSSGVYGIRANSLLADVTGSFTLTVQGGAPTTASGGPRSVRVGETVAGRLQESTPTLGDGSHYDAYVIDATAGSRLFVTMTSTDFDTYLRWGPSTASFEATDYDDDGGGGTNSRLEIDVSSSGRYVIQANSFGADATGTYTLSVTSTTAGGTTLPSITLGQTLSARLESSDPTLSDNSHYELYAYRGRAGEQVLVTMRSGDFDAYLAVGSMAGESFESDQTNDDGGGGTDAQVLATLGADGVLAIRANSLRAAETGAFTLNVSGVGGAAPAQPNVPAGTRVASAGQRLTGTLRTSDPMLADSSFINDWVYSGAPGDRVRIRLESSDFDAYLQWGRLSGDRFEREASDDDGGGGTNSMIEATVDGVGTFAIRVNSFAGGQTGAYTLSVERLTGPAPVVEAPVTGTAGKWHYAYVDSSDPDLRPFGQRAKQWGVLEQITSDLAARYVMPNDIDVSFDDCGMINAYYAPSEASITFCHELVALLAQIFLPADRSWTQEAQDQISGAVWFILMHEVGHALVHQLDLPITGREEDVADQLAVWTLMGTGEKGAQAALSGTLAIQPETDQFESADFADEHSLGPQRLFNVLCWIYGSDPDKYGGIVADGHLPEDRAVRCPGEWDRMSKAWERLLAPYSAQ
jgi:hypothetical protein